MHTHMRQGMVFKDMILRVNSLGDMWVEDPSKPTRSMHECEDELAAFLATANVSNGDGDWAAQAENESAACDDQDDAQQHFSEHKSDPPTLRPATSEWWSKADVAVESWSNWTLPTSDGDNAFDHSQAFVNATWSNRKVMFDQQTVLNENLAGADSRDEQTLPEGVCMDEYTRVYGVNSERGGTTESGNAYMQGSCTYKAFAEGASGMRGRGRDEDGSGPGADIEQLLREVDESDSDDEAQAGACAVSTHTYAAILKCTVFGVGQFVGACF
jgi:hypothetical protein